MATLTGACVVALGHHHSGLFSPDDGLAGELLEKETLHRAETDDRVKGLFIRLPEGGMPLKQDPPDWSQP